MTTTPPEGNPGDQPTDQPDAVDPAPATADFYVEPDDDDAKGHAVYDVELGQFVSGVMSKADAGKAKRTLADGDDAIAGHKLEVRSV